MSDEITKNNDEEEANQENADVNKLLDMKYYSYLAYLSYFLLIINTVIAPDPTLPLFGILLPLGTIFSFSTYIYLRKNDERFEFLFLKNFNVNSMLQICLLMLVLYFSIVFLFEGFEFILLIIPYWLVFFSLSFEEVESAQPLSASKSILKFTLYFLSVFFFSVGYYYFAYSWGWSVPYDLVIMSWCFCIVCFYFAIGIKNNE